MRIRAVCILVVALLAAAGRPTGAASPRVETPGEAPTRLVILKFDGLPPGAVDEYVRMRDARTGRSVLPWIDALFYSRGVRFENFYSRGASLSAPSWSILDTGQHALLEGNFEYDRNTGATSDFLDFVGFYYRAYKKRSAYPSAIEIFDAARTPLLSDAFQFEERETGLQLMRRGTKWFDFLNVGLGPTKGPVAEKFGDLLVGVDFHKSYDAATLASLVAALKNPAIRYVDYYNANFDKVLHDDNTSKAIETALRDVDRAVGTAYAALEASGTADRTVLAVVSDHGMTYDENGPFSQGVNLAAYLGRREFGAHHLMTKGGPLASYSLRGTILKPWVAEPPVTSSKESLYLADRPEQVTCALDYDGNERSEIHFRDPDLNRLQMMRRALVALAPSDPRRRAVGDAALAILAARRAAWTAEADEIDEELAALDRFVARETPRLAALEAAARVRAEGRKKQGADPQPGLPLAPFAGASTLNTSNPDVDADQTARELAARLAQYGERARAYGAYRDSLRARTRISSAAELAAAPESTLFGTRDLGRNLTLADLRGYPVGLNAIALASDGSLDASKTFATVDYLAAFAALRVRNSVRADMGTAPVAYSAVALPAQAVARALAAAGVLDASAVDGVTRAELLYAGDDRQIVRLTRGPAGAQAAYALFPVRDVALDPATGAVSLAAAAWRADLPLRLYDDPGFAPAGADRSRWLSSFHTDREWLAAVHATRDGLGIVGLAEVFSAEAHEAYAHASTFDRTEDERLLRRLELRRRDAVVTDLFLEAAPHWNFDLKDFNPGGNHGGFGRQSMHAVWWIRGGASTRVPVGPTVIAAPYDGLDVAPTLFELAGVTRDGALPDPLARAGFRPFPGRIAREAFAGGGP